MRALAFESDEALRVALTSGVVPDTVASRPADCWRETPVEGTDVEGALWIRPRRKLGNSVLQALREAGVRGADVDAPPHARSVTCWAEAVPPRVVGEPDRIDEVLFVASPDRWLETAAELLRLGCDRQRYQVGEQALLHVHAPPYFTVARALEDDALRVYRPVAERVWIRLECDHPLLRAVQPGEDELLLVERDGTWTTLALDAWQPIDPLVELTLPGGATPFVAGEAPARIQVPLRLVRTGRPRPPSLWLITGNAWEAMERLLRDLPEPAQRGLAFAVGQLDGAAVVLVRARPGHSLAELAVEAARFAPHPLLASLWLPCDASLEPPLGAERLRELTGAGPRRAVVMQASDDGPRALTVAEDAFAPLEDWVDYVIHTHADAIAPWVRSSTFDFDVLEVALPTAKERAPRDRLPRGDDEWGDEELPRAPAPAPKARPKRKPTTPRVVSPQQRSAAEEDVRALEAAFFETDAPPEARLDQWDELARAYVAVERLDQAAHAWLRVAWERDDPEVWRTWLDALGGPAEAVAPERRRDGYRLVATVVVDEELDLAPFIPLLDQHGRDLDVRAQWIAQRAIARRTDDVLRLTRARDSILGELRRGLSLDRDVPHFIRARATGIGEGDAVDAIDAALRKLQSDLEDGKRKRSASEAPLDHSLAYALRMLAWAHARIGQLDPARALAADAAGRLDPDDVIHSVLLRMLDARIEQASSGLPPTAPLPGPLQAELNELSTFQRYTVDRLRGGSRILEPVEHLDAVDAFRRAESDPRGEAFAKLRGVEDPRVVDDTLGTILEAATGEEPEERARLYGGAMDFFYVLPMTRARTLVERVVADLDDLPPMTRALLLEEALVLAAHLGVGGLVERLTSRLENLAGELRHEQASTLAQVLRGALRSLRRMGLRERAASLLDAVADHTEGDEPPLRVARMHLAGGLAFLGEIHRAEELVADEAGRLDGEITIKQRVDLIRAIADAVAAFESDRRLKWAEVLARQLPSITDSFSSNSHFCLSLLHYTESMIHALVPLDDQRGGPAGAWLDEDEHRVRRRIHADLREMT